MIRTAIEHAIIAVILQVMVALYLLCIHDFAASQALLAGGFSACIGFIFREVSQHEQKGGGANKVGIFYGLKHHWSLDSALDVLFPMISTAAVFWFFGTTWGAA